MSKPNPFIKSIPSNAPSNIIGNLFAVNSSNTLFASEKNENAFSLNSNPNPLFSNSGMNQGLFGSKNNEDSNPQSGLHQQKQIFSKKNLFSNTNQLNLNSGFTFGGNNLSRANTQTINNSTNEDKQQKRLNIFGSSYQNNEGDEDKNKQKINLFVKANKLQTTEKQENTKQQNLNIFPAENSRIVEQITMKKQKKSINILRKQMEQPGNLSQNRNQNQEEIKQYQKLSKYKQKSQQLKANLITQIKNREDDIKLITHQQLEAQFLNKKKHNCKLKLEQVDAQIQQLKAHKQQLLQQQKAIKQKSQMLELPTIQHNFRQDRKYTSPQVNFDKTDIFKFFSDDLQAIQNFKIYRKELKDHKTKVDNQNQQLKNKLDRIKSQILQFNKIDTEKFHKISQAQQNELLDQLKMKSKILKDQYKIYKGIHRKDRPKEPGQSKVQMGVNSQDEQDED